jgi:hypothetical protein
VGILICAAEMTADATFSKWEELKPDKSAMRKWIRESTKEEE